MIVIGSRESQLAMIQANHVLKTLKEQFPDKEFEIKGMTTTGDQVLDTALSKIGTKALFTKELEVALDLKQIDLIVHSLKDLPTQMPPGMLLGAVMERENPLDCVIMSIKHQQYRLDTLPPNSVVGTSSVRRSAQLKAKYPHLVFESVRGNLNTRLRKLDEDDTYSCLLLAYAGVHRMGWDSRITQVLEPEVMLHAVGQGALGIEIRDGDAQILDLVRSLNHNPSELRCFSEREFMRQLEGGCSVPLGVSTDLIGDQLTLTGSVTSLDGKQQLKASLKTDLSGDHPQKLQQAQQLGSDLAQILIKQGATTLLQEIRHQQS
ncbi:porphobilinogen deaminase, dipyromethane cofactor binding domain-containing protein [Gorgonomyces haynaldii]|nr:porphobilinogen deaminase, dipyromethane cofactor binding domain-containing protein [Gorgonomyces haynaldii]